MSLTTEGMTPADLAAVMGGNNGFGNGFGGDGWWIILLLLFANGGWGNGFGGYGGGGGLAAEGAMLYPWMNQSNQFNDGFQNQMLNDNITSIRDGVTGISTQLCNGFNGVQMSLANGFAGVEQGANARQMADMQQMFGIQSALQNCCCENRAGIADLKYTVATENCADRTQAMQNTRDIIDSQTRSTQAVLDKLCQLELDNVKAQLAQAQRDNIGLQNQVNMASFRESQTAQNALITQGFANEVDQLYNRLRSCPIGTVPVAGSTPLFSCNPSFNGNNGCGCGGNF